MVSVSDSSFTTMFASGPDMNDYNRYPDPPHSDTTSPMEMSDGMYSLPVTMAFDPSLYATEVPSPHYDYSCLGGGNHPSPSLYPEEADMQMAPASLSTASVNSATSSAVGSPQSNPTSRTGTTAADWNCHTAMGLQPSIVGNDFMSPEYAGYASAGMEDALNFDFSHAKGFVGE